MQPTKSPVRRVLIIQREIKQYRAPFFDRLHELLADDGIELRVLYSDPSQREVRKRDSIHLDPEYGIRAKAVWFFRDCLIYQAAWRQSLIANLIIIEHANKHMINYPLLCGSMLRLKKVAFWGHGRNRQSQGRKLRDWLKKQTLACVDWWFAYTAGTADYLLRSGFPAQKITIVQNALDTTLFERQLRGIPASELAAARRALAISEDSRIGLFCGGVTAEKLPDFLVCCADKIKQLIPEFHLLVLGGGPAQREFERAAARNSWFHYLGPRFGRDKALWFRVADAFLMPGAVGLAILDAFAAGLPVLTTEMPLHGPEVEYVRPGENGLIAAYTLESYSAAVAGLLKDHSELTRLKVGALTSAHDYTLENMVQNFRRGILQCLAADSQIAP